MIFFYMLILRYLMGIQARPLNLLADGSQVVSGVGNQCHHAGQVISSEFILLPNIFKQQLELLPQVAAQLYPSLIVCVERVPAFAPVPLVWLALQSSIGICQAPTQVLDVGGDGSAGLIAVGRPGCLGGSNPGNQTQDPGVRARYR